MGKQQTHERQDSKKLYYTLFDSIDLQGPLQIQ